MLRTILKYGAIAGVVVGGFMFATFLGFGGEPPMDYAMLIGYATMLIAKPDGSQRRHSSP